MPCSTRLPVLLLMLSSITAAEPVFPGPSWEEAAPASQGCDAVLLDQACRRFGEICGPDGSQRVLVVRGGRVVWRGDDIGELQRIYSCTKSVLSLCLGLLWDDGRCTPDTRVADILPQLAASYPALTLGQLSAMTGGYEPAGGNLLEPGPPLHPPGAAFHYGKQQDLLAVALTHLAGEPLRDLFMRRIGAPIGIADTEVAWGPLDLPGEAIPVHGGAGAAPAGLSMTAQALARIGWLCCQRGRWNGQQLFSERYLAAATAIRVPSTLPPHDPKGWYTVLLGRYGFGWWLNGRDRDGTLTWPSLPEGSYAAQGNRNNICIIIPAWDTVVVRVGTDKAVDARLYDEALALLRQALERGGGIPAGR